MARDRRRETVFVNVDLPFNTALCELDDVPDAGWLYVTSMCVSGASGGRGIVSPRASVRLAGVAAELGAQLISAGLWHEPGHDCDLCVQPPDGKVVIHGFFTKGDLEDLPHILYRFYDAAGALLYVGITYDQTARWRKHAKEKSWWGEVASTKVEEHESRSSALTSEYLAITCEKPRYNVAHNSRADD